MIRLSIEVCHYDYSQDPKDDKFLVEFTFKPTKNAKDGDIINIKGSVFVFGQQSKTLQVTLSNNALASNFLNSTLRFPKVMENTTIATLDDGNAKSDI